MVAQRALHEAGPVLEVAEHIVAVVVVVVALSVVPSQEQSHYCPRSCILKGS